MQRVAERAKISKAVVYRHFANRSEQVTALFEQSWLRIDQVVAARVAHAIGAAERIEPASRVSWAC